MLAVEKGNTFALTEIIKAVEARTSTSTKTVASCIDLQDEVIRLKLKQYHISSM